MEKQKSQPKEKPKQEERKMFCSHCGREIGIYQEYICGNAVGANYHEGCWGFRANSMSTT